MPGFHPGKFRRKMGEFRPVGDEGGSRDLPASGLPMNEKMG